MGRSFPIRSPIQFSQQIRMDFSELYDPTQTHAFSHSENLPDRVTHLSGWYAVGT